MNDGQNILLFREPGPGSIFGSTVDNNDLIRHSDPIVANAFSTIDQHSLSVERPYDDANLNIAHCLVPSDAITERRFEAFQNP
jgi:hypothetical protein